MSEEFDMNEDSDDYSLVCDSSYSDGTEVLEFVRRVFGNRDSVGFIVETIENNP
jgi:hypothetical protein